MVFKYQNHDSLLEKEDDLTEEEKRVAWAQYVQEEKAYEAKLAIEKLLRKTQEASSFFDSDAEFSDIDPLWDEIVGNSLEDPTATVCDNESSLKSELPESAPLQHTPSIDSLGNDQEIVRSSSPILKIEPVYAQFGTHPLMPQVVATNVMPRPRMIHTLNKTSLNTFKSSATVAPTLLSFAKNVPSEVPFAIRQATSSQNQDVPKNLVARHRIIQIQNKPLTDSTKSAAEIAPTLLPILKNKPTESKVFTYLPARRILLPRLENTSTQITDVENEVIPNDGLIQKQHKPSMNTIENATGNDCTKVAAHSPPPITSTNETQQKFSIDRVANARVVAASSDSFPGDEPNHSQVDAHSSLPKPGKY